MPLPPPSECSTCLVTGASSGIGVELARQLAAKGHGVTLVARREDKLRELAEELERKHNVRVEVIACDLSDATARDRLAATVTEKGLDVEVLLNNAGFGSAGEFHKLDSAGEVRMVRTNVEAVVDLCGRYVPGMVERGRGAVLNVASTAGFQPLPRQSTYAASKAFVLSFTEAISSDLKGTGVTATALCPGPVRRNAEFDSLSGAMPRRATSGLSMKWKNPKLQRPDLPDYNHIASQPCSAQGGDIEDQERSHAGDLAALEHLADRYRFDVGDGKAEQIFRSPDGVKRAFR